MFVSKILFTDITTVLHAKTGLSLLNYYKLNYLYNIVTLLKKTYHVMVKKSG